MLLVSKYLLHLFRYPDLRKMYFWFKIFGQNTPCLLDSHLYWAVEVLIFLATWAETAN
jgi:hypothetical protein